MPSSHGAVSGARVASVTGVVGSQDLFGFLPAAGELLHGAACVGTDPDLFFPDPSDVRRVEQAKAVCAECPVIAECLAGALRRGEKHGIFGGLTETERVNLVRRASRPRKRAVAECGTLSGYRRHRRLDESACLLCRAAMAEESRKAHAGRRAARRAEAEGQVAA